MTIVVTGPSSVEPFLQAFVADHFDEFEKENLNVSVEQVPPAATGPALLLTDRAQVMLSGVTPTVLNVIGEGNDIRLVAQFADVPDTSKAGFWVNNSLLSADGKLDPCVMEGKKVAFGSLGGIVVSSSFILGDFMAQCDLTLLDVDAQSITAPDGLAGLESGAIDMAFLPDPLWLQAPSDATLVLPYAGKSIGGFYFSDFRTKNPEAAEAVVRALVRTTRTYLQGDYYADPQVGPVVADILGAPLDNLKQKPPLFFPPDMIPDKSLIPVLQEAWLAADLLTYDSALPADRVIDTGILDKALGR